MDDDQIDIMLNGERLRPDVLGALYWRAEKTLIVSDLHFEKGSSFASRGTLLPPYDTKTTLMRLEALFARYHPERVISLGDAFHDLGAEARIDNEDAEHLEGLTQRADWTWILGNHDPEPPKRFRGQALQEMTMGALLFRHEPASASANGEIAGHLHPCARVVHERRSLRRRCFATDSKRLIMPALGAYTGGLNVLDQAFDTIFDDPVAWMMGDEGVYPVRASKLAPDSQRAWQTSARIRRSA